MRDFIKQTFITILIMSLFTSCFHLSWESPLLDGPTVPVGHDDDDDDDNGLNLAISSLTLASDNSTLDVVFNKAVYSSTGATGALAKEDFLLNFSGNNGGIIGVNINSVTHSAGDSSATLNLTVNGDSYGVETVDLSANGDTAIYDATGSALSSTYHSVPVTFNNGYLAGYSYRRKVVINSSQVAADLTGFPLLFSGSSADFKTTASGGAVTNPSGYDIVFIGPDGVSPLPFEIDSFDGAAGSIRAWVKLANLPGSYDSFFYIYYGNSAISSSQENSSQVWNGNYRAVWHLNETSGGVSSIVDAGPFGYNGTDMNGPLMNQPGKISGALKFDGVDDYIDLGTAHIVDNSVNFTFSTWLYLTAAPGGMQDFSIWDRRRLPENDSFAFSIGDYGPAGNSQIKVAYSDAGPTLNWIDHLSNSNIPVPGWVYVAVVFDGTNLNFYYNGTPDGSMPFTPSPYIAGFGQAIGRAGEVHGNYYMGWIDELRISDTNRSSAWIATEYNNQNNPAAFYIINSAEPTP